MKETPQHTKRDIGVEIHLGKQDEEPEVSTRMMECSNLKSIKRR